MIIDRGENQPRSTSDRPIIYSSGTLSLCGSPPTSPYPFRSPLRPQGLEQSSRPPWPAAASTPTPAAGLLSPSKHTQAQTSLSPPKSPGLHIQRTTPLENMHLAKIKELEARIEELTEASSTAAAAAEQSAALEAEWRSKALEAEAKLAQNTAIEVEEANSQRSKLVEELKGETVLWRRKFDELVEEHSALQSRLESATAQVSLLDKALSTVRGDTADSIAALATAEALLLKKTEEFEADKKEKEALIIAKAEAHATAVTANKDKDIEGLCLQNQRLSKKVDVLKRQVQTLTATVEVLEQKDCVKKAATVQTPPGEVAERKLFKERDSNKISNNNNNDVSSHRTEKAAIVESKTVYPALSAPSAENKEILSPARPLPPPLQRHQGPSASHFDAAKALIARTAELEGSLMAFNIERSALETEISKFPNGTAGRTVAARNRKKEIEQRVEVLNKKISSVRLELRKLGIR